MSMKKTDLEKHLAKKLDGRMKSGIAPQRFGKGSAAAAHGERKAGKAVARLVPVACRLPAELVARLRERASSCEGGMSAVLAQAAEQWLASAAGTPPAAPPTASSQAV